MEFSPLTTTNRNIAELLRYQPGVAVTVLSRNDANWGSYGGLGPKYNSYLLDGFIVLIKRLTMFAPTTAMKYACADSRHERTASNPMQ